MFAEGRLNNAILEWDENELNSLKKKEKAIARALLNSVSYVLYDGSLLSKPLTLNDNFFFVGGNSLNAVRVITKLRDQGFWLGNFVNKSLPIAILLSIYT